MPSSYATHIGRVRATQVKLLTRFATLPGNRLLVSFCDVSNMWMYGIMNFEDFIVFAILKVFFYLRIER